MSSKNRKPKPRKSVDALAYERQQRITRARMLDRLADAELQHGHVGAAERLAHRAAEIREVAQ
jgi:hypothetical protein